MKITDKLLLKDTHVCPWWLAYSFDNPLRLIFHRPDQILRPYLLEGMTAVDIGCGMGFFCIPMAVIVGEQGRVIAVDIQQKMLDVVAKRALARGVNKRISLHRCTSGSIGLDCEADFVLTFWMAHEVPNIDQFMVQVLSLLKPGGKYLVAEPKMHVDSKGFEKISEAAASAGFQILSRPKIALSRAALFEALKKE